LKYRNLNGFIFGNQILEGFLCSLELNIFLKILKTTFYEIIKEFVLAFLCFLFWNFVFEAIRLVYFTSDNFIRILSES